MPAIACATIAMIENSTIPKNERNTNCPKKLNTKPTAPGIITAMISGPTLAWNFAQP